MAHAAQVTTQPPRASTFSAKLTMSLASEKVMQLQHRRPLKRFKVSLGPPHTLISPQHPNVREAELLLDPEANAKNRAQLSPRSLYQRLRLMRIRRKWMPPPARKGGAKRNPAQVLRRLVLILSVAWHQGAAPRPLSEKPMMMWMMETETLT